jgi:hypothetical protein
VGHLSFWNIRSFSYNDFCHEKKGKDRHILIYNNNKLTDTSKL